MDEKEKSVMKRKKSKFVEEVTFTSESYSQISNSTGDYLLCKKFAQVLPLGLSFDDSLAQFDARFGADEFDETADEENKLTRRWRTDVTGDRHRGGLDVLHYLLIVNFIETKAVAVRISVR